MRVRAIGWTVLALTAPDSICTSSGGGSGYCLGLYANKCGDDQVERYRNRQPSSHPNPTAIVQLKIATSSSAA